MKAIPFTQFLMPHGEQKRIEIFLPDQCREKYDEITKAGCRLTAEVLQTGACSFCIEDPKDGDFECIVVANGPGVSQAIEKMLMEFTPERFAQWKHDCTEETL